MININTNKTLNIILPNTNKALKEVLLQSSQTDLNKLTSNKDLNSIINSLLKESSQDTKQNKILLDLVKNNPTLKNLGNISSTLKELTYTLKLEKSPLKIETTLKTFISDIKDIDEKNLQTKVKNSGLFVENKLKNIQTPKQELHSLLNKLEISLKETKLPNVKSINKELKILLKSDLFKPQPIKELLQTSTPKELKTIQIQVKSLQNELLTIEQNIKNPKIKNISKELTNFIQKTSPIENNSIKSPNNNSGIIAQKQELYPLVLKLSNSLEQTSLISLKNITTQLLDLLIPNKEELSQISKKVEIILDKFKERTHSNFDKSTHPDDILFSKDIKNLFTKISTLNKVEQLNIQTKIKELFSQDFKVLLHQAHEEISTSNSPNKQELLKHIDKLTLQIDYHQLVSHLSNSTSLYIPYSWDALEDGTISIKNKDNENFFTDIHLQLKEYGELKLRLGMFEKNQLNINIATKNEKLKSMLKASLPILRQQLFDVGIHPKEIRFLYEKQNLYNEVNSDIAVGFEVKA